MFESSKRRTKQDVHPIAAGTTPDERSEGTNYIAASLAHQDRTAMIAEAAYFRAAQRNFSPGQELEDWLAAEREIESQLR